MAVTKLDIVKRLPEYRNISLSVDDITGFDYTPICDCEREVDPLVKQIFAPDPVTGIPRSDLHFIMSRDTNPELALFIRDTLMRPFGSDLNAGDDKDLALDAVRNRGESLQAYADRILQITQASLVKLTND